MKIIQITDIHLSQDPKERLFGLVNAEQTFYDVLQAVKSHEPDLVLATGDLSQDGSQESYQRLANYLEQLDCNVYVIQGNHDNPINFTKYLVAHNIKHEEFLAINHVNFIFLNSYADNNDNGFIDKRNLLHLTTHLSNYDNCVPVIHHHFVPLGNFVDGYILTNHQELVSTMAPFAAKIKFCITGHVHNSYLRFIHGIKVYSSLSTCIQFAPMSEIAFANKKPGFTIYNLQGDNYEVIEQTL